MESILDRRRLQRVWLFWALLALPAVALIVEKFVRDIPGGKFFYWTGVISVVLILLSLLATPVRRLWPRAALGAWLVRQRRYLGVAGFAYAALHTAFWLQRTDMARFLHSFIEPRILTGWLGIAILAVMALVSNDSSVRRLGPTWKNLQRWIYIGAPLTMLHWLLAADRGLVTPIVYSVLLAALLAVRLGVARRRAPRP